MKAHTQFRVLAFLGLLNVSSLAQEPAGRPPDMPRDERPHRQHAPPGRGEEMEGRGRPFVDRWLQRLQQERPDEFTRLMQLKEKDPDVFPMEIRRLLQKDLAQKLQRERPAIHQALQSLSAEDREWLMSRLFGGESQKSRGPEAGERMGPGRPPNPEAGDGDAEIRRLAKALREADNPRERERVSASLRNELRQSFTRKHEQRRQDLDEMEVRLKEARAFHREREKMREAIIEQRMRELAAPPGSPPAPPSI